jgi:hypothetical protein
MIEGWEGARIRKIRESENLPGYSSRKVFEDETVKGASG